MSSNKQIVYRSTEGKHYTDIKALEEPIPEVDKHEILVKIKAVALNYRDLIISNNTYGLPIKEKVIPGSDAAGEVVKVGSSVTSIQVGDHVVFNVNPSALYGFEQDMDQALGAPADGVLQQYKATLPSSVVKIPSDSHLSWGEAASLACAGITAWNCLYGGPRFTAGQTVLLLGTGGVSMIALIVARAAGAITIITSSSDEKLKYVKEKFGADHTVNYKKHPDWEKEVLRLTGGKGADYIVENGGNGTLAKSIASVRVGGHIGLVGFLSRTDVLPDIAIPLMKKSASLRGIAVGNKQLFEELIQFVHAKKIHMPVDKEFGFSEKEVHKAYSYLEGQSHIGKIVINVE